MVMYFSLALEQSEVWERFEA